MSDELAEAARQAGQHLLVWEEDREWLTDHEVALYREAISNYYLSTLTAPTPVTPEACEAMGAREGLKPIERLLNLAKDFATNYDCDHDCNAGGRCRVCESEIAIREVLGSKADSLLNGPYYGSRPEIVESLKAAGCPVDHLQPTPTLSRPKAKKKNRDL